MKPRPTSETLKQKGLIEVRPGCFERLNPMQLASIKGGQSQSGTKLGRPEVNARAVQELHEKRQKPTLIFDTGIVRVRIKPITANRAWKGKRYKTDEYKLYCEALPWLLPKIDLPKPPYQIYFKFGLSNSLADGDNCLKQTQDIIAKHYGFNDKLIFKWIIEKVNVEKGLEFFDFHITSYK